MDVSITGIDVSSASVFVGVAGDLAVVADNDVVVPSDTQVVAVICVMIAAVDIVVSVDYAVRGFDVLAEYSADEPMWGLSRDRTGGRCVHQKARMGIRPRS